MADEYFWGVELSASNKEHKWEPDELKENGDSKDFSLTAKGEHVLLIKQALLTKAPEGEYNVIELETTGYKQTVKTPIATLIGGKILQSNMDLTLPDPPVTLRLVEGSGPVYILGSHAIHTEPYNDDDDDDDDLMDETVDEEEDEEEEEIEEEKVGKSSKAKESPKKGKVEEKGKKRASSASAQNPPAKKKKGAADS